MEVKLEMDELDLTAAESKATYEEIKVYVKKQTQQSLYCTGTVEV